MPNNVSVDKISVNDDDWENAMEGLNEDEFIAYARNVIRVFDARGHLFPSIAPEMIEHLRRLADVYERNIRDERIAIQNEAIARAKLQRTADDMLLNMKDDKRGN